MVSIPQTKIALYLHDYAKLTSLMLNYPDSQPFTLFQNYLLRSNRLEDATEEYYQRMLNTAYIFTKMKIFSIAEDYTLKQLPPTNSLHIELLGKLSLLTPKKYSKNLSSLFAS